MKNVVLTVLAALCAAGAYADDEWVSVGGAAPVAPAASTQTIDSSSRAVVQTPAQASSPLNNSPASSDLVSELYLQVEQMQAEIATLRGQLEEQTHQLKRMKQEQQERYLDLDRRVSSLYSSPAAASTPATSTPASEPQQPQLSATEAYKQAQKLMYEKKYSEANQAYETFAEQYPDDALAVNAVYWSGEIYLLQGDLDKALSRFRTVVDDHPDHLKVPDAMYKTGYTLGRQGKTEEAKTWMKKVVAQYEGKADTVVRLAKNYLQSH
ncbi:MAG: tol-pal system protein YbgF [Oceanospirillaceae bacterium]|nr:tol-pal system protein YbgF [Oceanospirillaceae bacterium]|tara:strand:+ start:8681 stop:9481 length:801 start_codon:yes stop_codon:yes gene_type:complete